MTAADGMTARADGAGAEDAPAIEARGLSKRFGARRALRDVGFTLPRGARLAVFGPNGAGKTTLLRVLATLERATSGSFRVLGRDPREEADDIRARIGLVSHQPMLYLDLTAEENLVLYARLYGCPDPRGHAAGLLQRVGLSHRANDVVRGFSRGMTQRLALARALVNDPELVFLDEPYSGLDPHAARIVDDMFEDAPRPRTLVTVSHSLERDFGHATHVLLLARGRQVLFSDTASLHRDEFAALCDAQAGER